jgi:hypothetical protein
MKIQYSEGNTVCFTQVMKLWRALEKIQKLHQSKYKCTEHVEYLKAHKKTLVDVGYCSLQRDVVDWRAFRQ